MGGNKEPLGPVRHSNPCCLRSGDLRRILSHSSLEKPLRLPSCMTKATFLLVISTLIELERVFE